MADRFRWVRRKGFRHCAGAGGATPLFKYTDGTFTRTSDATWFDPTTGTLYLWSSGQLRKVTSQFPAIVAPNRLPYYAFEGSRTNLVTHSRGQLWTDAAWNGGGFRAGSGTDDYDYGPDGQLMADRSTPNSGQGGAVDLIGIVSGAHVGSCFVKAGPGATDYQLVAGQGTVGQTGVAIGAPTSTWAYAETSIAATNGVANSYVLPVDGTDRTAVGGQTARNRDVITDCHQFEAGAFASSFIPTAGATATRAADVLTYASAPANVDSAWSFYLRPRLSSNPITAAYVTTIWLFNIGGNTNEGIVIRHTAGTARIAVYDAAAGIRVQSASCTWSANQELKITVNPTTGELTLAGFTTGNGTTSGTPWTFTAGTFRVAHVHTGNSTLAYYGLMTEPF